MPLFRFAAPLVLLSLLPLMGWAQNAGKPVKDPVEITADDAIEWRRDQHLYRARGNAMVKQGATTIRARTIEAAYTPGPNGQGGEQDIKTVTADGDVVITSEATGKNGPETRTITAGHGVYDLASGELVLTGGTLKITTQAMTVTADRQLAYDRLRNKATATGNAVITTPERTLAADTITAWLTQDNTLSKAAASGRVRIKTAEDYLEADRGDYDATGQQAVMTGNVRLTRGQNHLQGGKAVVDLKTGVSLLFGSSDQPSANSGTGRVRALFFPGGNADLMPGNATDSMIPLRPENSLSPRNGALPALSRGADYKKGY